MLKMLDMPEKIAGKKCDAVKRSHRFDNEILAIATNENRELIGRYINWPHRINSMQDVIDGTESLTAGWDSGEIFAYALISKSNAFLGMIDIHNIDYKNHSAELGYWLDKKAYGNGYMTEMVSRIEKEAFDNGIVRLVINCHPENIASNNVALRNGYTLEATLKKARYHNGEFCDKNVYAKINPKYKEANKVKE